MRFSRSRLSGAHSSIHPDRKPQEIKTVLRRVHRMRLGLVEAEGQAFQHLTHDFQRFLDLFPAQHDNAIRVAHEVRLQFAFEAVPMPNPIQQL